MSRGILDWDFNNEFNLSDHGNVIKEFIYQLTAQCWQSAENQRTF